MHNIFNNTDNTISPMNSERNLNAGSRSNQNKGTHTPSHYRFSTKCRFFFLFIIIYIKELNFYFL